MQRAMIGYLAGFLLAGASMAADGRGVEPSTSDPDAWRTEMAEFEREDAERPPPTDAMLFVGSSSIRLWDLGKSFPNAPAINRGFGGSQICDATAHADLLVIKHHPRVVVFYAGDNDVAAGKSPEQVHVDFQAFVANVRESLPETPLVFISIKPSIDRWKHRDVMRKANRLIAETCAADDTLEFLDVWPAMLGADGLPRKELFRDDGLHLNDAGYRLWSDLVRPLLQAAAVDASP
jgi:lysophospholipase L1-like esterase